MRNLALGTMLAAAAMVTPHAQGQEVVAARQAAERGMVETKMQMEKMGVEARVTRAAPYSAESVTESVQALADGNRIVTKNTVRIFRDGEGRVRREQLNGTGTDPVAINITDPVAGTTYVLDPASHMAFRGGMIIADSAGGNTVIGARSPADGTVVTRIVRDEPPPEVVVKAKAEAEMKMRTMVNTGAVGGGVYSVRIGQPEGKTTREDLGQQTIEGVAANGTRATTVIPAGAIGNEQPMTIVSEQWFSPDLQVLVLTKHTDPRVGETTYRLTSIVRAEPARSLFDLPPDYTLKESAIKRDMK